MRISLKTSHITVMILILLLSLPTTIQAQDAVVNQIVSLVNQARGDAGIAPVSMNFALNAAAQRHSNDMANTLNLTHTGSDGSEFWHRMADAGYGLTTGGENVLFRWDASGAGAFDQWRASPPHNANMMNPDFREIGVAYAQGGNGAFYFTMVLGTSPNSPSTSVQPTAVLPTPIPPTPVPPTPIPPTPIPPTPVPPTQIPPTTIPPTVIPPTQIPQVVQSNRTQPTQVIPTNIPPTLAPAATAQIVMPTSTPITIAQLPTLTSLTNALPTTVPDTIVTLMPSSTPMQTSTPVINTDNNTPQNNSDNNNNLPRSTAVALAPVEPNQDLSLPYNSLASVIQLWGRNFISLAIANLTVIEPTPMAETTVNSNSSSNDISDIRLTYTDTTFTLINTSGQTLDLSQLSFESTNGVFFAFQWNNEFLSQSLNAFTTNDCLQITVGNTPTKPFECDTRHSWVSAGQGDFWRDAIVFNVRNGENRIGICEVIRGVCDLSLSGDTQLTEADANNTNVPTTVINPDVRLVYNDDNLTLINISGRTLDLAGLLFTSDTSQMQIDKWQTEFLSASLSGFPAGDCLQVWGLGNNSVRNKPNECDTRHAWIAVGDTFTFWRGNFTVNRYTETLTTCNIANGVCEFSMDSNNNNTPVSNVAPTSVPASPVTSGNSLRIINTGNGIILLNNTALPANVSNIAFESDNGVMLASRWDSPDLSRPLTALPTGDCLEVWSIGSNWQDRSPECNTRHSWIAVGQDQQFWDNVNTYRVRIGGQVLATCETRVAFCDVPLP